MRFIDADEFIKDECNNCDGACESLPCDCLECKADCRCDFIKDLEAAHTIDAVPVVRCKDCKHRKTCVCPMQEAEFNEWECDFEYYDYTEDDGYCHKGERKDE